GVRGDCGHLERDLVPVRDHVGRGRRGGEGGRGDRGPCEDTHTCGRHRRTSSRAFPWGYDLAGRRGGGGGTNDQGAVDEKWTKAPEGPRKTTPPARPMGSRHCRSKALHSTSRSDCSAAGRRKFGCVLRPSMSSASSPRPRTGS